MLSVVKSKVGMVGCMYLSFLKEKTPIDRKETLGPIFPVHVISQGQSGSFSSHKSLASSPFRCVFSGSLVRDNVKPVIYN